MFVSLTRAKRVLYDCHSLGLFIIFHRWTVFCFHRLTVHAKLCNTAYGCWWLTDGKSLPVYIQFPKRVWILVLLATYEVEKPVRRSKVLQLCVVFKLQLVQRVWIILQTCYRLDLKVLTFSAITTLGRLVQSQVNLALVRIHLRLSCPYWVINHSGCLHAMSAWAWWEGEGRGISRQTGRSSV